MSDKNDCKGLIFRGECNSYISKGKYVYRESMALLKRQSCEGCEKCGWILDDLTENVANGFLPIINNIENRCLYKLEIINKTKDWETGYVDGYDFEFQKINA